MKPAERIRRIKQALAETERYIAIESPRDPALRPPEIAALLQAYIAHRAKLQRMLEGAPGPSASTMAEWREQNPNPTHGCGHMQGRGAA